MTNHRFNQNIDNIPDALEYYRNRIIQYLTQDLSWDGSYIDLGWGIQVKILDEGILYSSIYVFERGKGRLSQWFKQNPHEPYIVADECNAVVGWLSRSRATAFKPTVAAPTGNITYVNRMTTTEQKLVENLYAGDKTKRSKQFLMNHIDEGIYILNERNCSSAAKRAFALHPCIQDDEQLIKFYNSPNFSNSDSLILAMEYRAVANAHLSRHSPKNPKLSCFDDVNEMLIADKIQNCKDFEIYLLNHPEVRNKERLISYFHDEWFPALGITEECYQSIANDIQTKTGRANLLVPKRKA